MQNAKMNVVDLMLNESFNQPYLVWVNNMAFWTACIAFIALCLFYWQFSQLATALLFVLIIGFLKVVVNGVFSALIYWVNPKMLAGH